MEAICSVGDNSWLSPVGDQVGSDSRNTAALSQSGHVTLQPRRVSTDLLGSLLHFRQFPKYITFVESSLENILFSLCLKTWLLHPEDVLKCCNCFLFLSVTNV